MVVKYTHVAFQTKVIPQATSITITSIMSPKIVIVRV